MTEKQIEANAKAYIDTLYLYGEQEEENYTLTFIAGAHSMLPEIEKLKAEIKQLKRKKGQ